MIMSKLFLVSVTKKLDHLMVCGDRLWKMGDDYGNGERPHPDGND